MYCPVFAQQCFRSSYSTTCQAAVQHLQQPTPMTTHNCSLASTQWRQRSLITCLLNGRIGIRLGAKHSLWCLRHAFCLNSTGRCGENLTVYLAFLAKSWAKSYPACQLVLSYLEERPASQMARTLIGAHACDIKNADVVGQGLLLPFSSIISKSGNIFLFLRSNFASVFLPVLVLILAHQLEISQSPVPCDSICFTEPSFTLGDQTLDTNGPKANIAVVCRD